MWRITHNSLINLSSPFANAVGGKGERVRRKENSDCMANEWDGLSHAIATGCIFIYKYERIELFISSPRERGPLRCAGCIYANEAIRLSLSNASAISRIKVDSAPCFGIASYIVCCCCVWIICFLFFFRIRFRSCSWHSDSTCCARLRVKVHRP